MYRREWMSDELYHHGVKGMRWGHRKKYYDPNADRSGERVKYQNENGSLNKRKLKRGDARKMSSTELESVVKRMQMEKDYRTLRSETAPRQGARKAGKVVGKIAAGAAIGGAVVLGGMVAKKTGKKAADYASDWLAKKAKETVKQAMSGDAMKKAASAGKDFVADKVKEAGKTAGSIVGKAADSVKQTGAAKKAKFGKDVAGILLGRKGLFD